MRRGHRSMQRGFVLAATLWMLAILAVAAAYFAGRIQHAREQAQLAQTHSQALLDLDNARAEILFRIATTPFSVYGLGPSASEAIALDDRPYLGPGDTLIRLQDNRGLLNLNIVNDDRLDRFLNVVVTQDDIELNTGQKIYFVGADPPGQLDTSLAAVPAHLHYIHSHNSYF